MSQVILAQGGGGTSRCKKAVQASDHDMGLKDKLAPFGILNVMTGLLTLLFGTSFETSDFIVDCLEQWWNDNKLKFPKNSSGHHA